MAQAFLYGGFVGSISLYMCFGALELDMGDGLGITSEIKPE